MPPELPVPMPVVSVAVPVPVPLALFVSVLVPVPPPLSQEATKRERANAVTKIRFMLCVLKCCECCFVLLYCLCSNFSATVHAIAIYYVFSLSATFIPQSVVSFTQYFSLCHLVWRLLTTACIAVL
jgi:hypothetical protein